MKVLVIPDVHLKPEIFDQAEEIMETTDCEGIVCLGDIVDDWGCMSDFEKYEETMDRLIRIIIYRYLFHLCRRKKVRK